MKWAGPVVAVVLAGCVTACSTHTAPTAIDQLEAESRSDPKIAPLLDAVRGWGIVRDGENMQRVANYFHVACSDPQQYNFYGTPGELIVDFHKSVGIPISDAQAAALSPLFMSVCVTTPQQADA